MIYLDILETHYQEIIASFEFNKIIPHVVMICMIENHKDLKYYIELGIQIE